MAKDKEAEEAAANKQLEEEKQKAKAKKRKTNELTKGANEREEVNAINDKRGQAMSLSEDAQKEEDEAKADRPDLAINNHLWELNFQRGGQQSRSENGQRGIQGGRKRCRGNNPHPEEREEAQGLAIAKETKK